MHSQEEIDQQKELLAVHRRTLMHYLIQEASLGKGYVPPSVSAGIGETRNEIRRIKVLLRGWDAAVEDMPDDEPSVQLSSEQTSRQYPATPSNASGSSRSLRVFLCHSSDDKPTVRDLYTRLRIDGFEPWLDEEDLLPGQDWQQHIPKAVRSSDIVIVCLSRRATTKSGYVQKEIRYALDVADEQPEGTIFLIPLRLEECDIPDRLSRWHWVNYFEERGYERLKTALLHRSKTLDALMTPRRELRAQGGKQQPRDSKPIQGSIHQGNTISRATGATSNSRSARIPLWMWFASFLVLIMAALVTINLFSFPSFRATASSSTVEPVEPTNTPLPLKYDWSSLQLSITPSARGNYGLVYDTRRDIFVLFGGEENPSLLGDTWEWNGDQWLVRQLPFAPSARKNPAMIYDTTRGVVVLFGGIDSSGHTNDTWEYDGEVWKEISTERAPPARAESCEAYDPLRKTIVIFGGVNEHTFLNDTWTYDGQSWVQQKTRHAPTPRRVCAMAYDDDLGATILFGGWSSDGATKDTWEWDGSDWKEISTNTQPEARGGHALIYHSKLKKLILVGGDRSACTVLYQDTWTFDGLSWVKLQITSPGTHSSVSTAYSPKQDLLILFGGWSGGNNFCQVTDSMYIFNRK